METSGQEHRAAWWHERVAGTVSMAVALGAPLLLAVAYGQGTLTSESTGCESLVAALDTLELSAKPALLAGGLALIACIIWLSAVRNSGFRWPRGPELVWIALAGLLLVTVVTGDRASALAWYYPAWLLATGFLPGPLVVEIGMPPLLAATIAYLYVTRGGWPPPKLFLPSSACWLSLMWALPLAGLYVSNTNC